MLVPLVLMKNDPRNDPYSNDGNSVGSTAALNAGRNATKNYASTDVAINETGIAPSAALWNDDNYVPSTYGNDLGNAL